jgi:hypothetical protein
MNVLQRTNTKYDRDERASESQHNQHSVTSMHVQLTEIDVL